MCAAEEMVPIYLVVGGSTAIFYFLIVAVRKLYKRVRQSSSTSSDWESAEESLVDSQDKSHILCGLFDGVMSCFIIAWFIAGTV